MSKTYLDLISEATGKKCTLSVRKNLWQVTSGTGDQVRKIGHFYLEPLFGCCGVQVLSSLYAHSLDDGCENGLHELLDKMAQQLSYDAGYTVLMCTDKLSRAVRADVMKKNGWQQLDQFINKRTGNAVGIYSVDLQRTIPVGLYTTVE